MEEATWIRKIVGGQRDLFGDLIAPHLTPLSRKWRRKYASLPFVESTPADKLRFADQGNSPLMEYQRSETSAQLGAALARLPEKYRNIIVLLDLKDLRISEVAVRLGLTIPAVKTRHRRARLKVAEFLGRSRKFGPAISIAAPDTRNKSN